MKIFNKLMILVTVFGLSACGDDFLDLSPSNALPFETAIQTVNDLEAAVNGIYSQMQSSDWYGRYSILLPDIMSDDVKQNSNANRGRVWAEYTGTINDVQNIPRNTWTSIYVGVNRANFVINSNLEFPAAVQTQANQLIGEAYAVRALAHFDLVRLYAQHYGFTANASHPGVPVVTEFNQDAQPARNTVAEVYAQVKADLNQAISLMTLNRGKGRFTKNSAKAILARVSYYQGDLAAAGSLANEVITSGAYSLTAGSNLLAQWADLGDSPDAILDVVNNTLDNNGSESVSGMYNVSGYGDYLPSMDLVSLYDDADIRKGLFVLDNKLGGGSLGNLRQAKYFNPRGEDNLPVIRLPEMYLIRAEARAVSGDTAGAIEDLMTIRRRAWAAAPDVTATGAALVEEILLEKRLELAFEGHRLFELTRQKKGVVRVNCTAPAGSCTINYPNDFFVLPIPIEEINANPSMTQNPGY